MGAIHLQNEDTHNAKVRETYQLHLYDLRTGCHAESYIFHCDDDDDDVNVHKQCRL
jgi:hypothetical protein